MLECAENPGNCPQTIADVMKQKLIRVFIPAAPGSGDQVAALHAMDRLRAMGFTGSFEVVYDFLAVYKIAELLGYGADLKTYKPFEDLTNKLRFISKDYFVNNQQDFEVTPLSMSASVVSTDPVNHAAALKATAFYKTSTFPGEGYLPASRIRYYRNIFPDTDMMNNAPSHLIYPPSTLTDALTFLQNTKVGRKFATQKPIFIPLIKAMQQKRLNTFSIYGMNTAFKGTNPAISIVNLLLGACQAQLTVSALQKPLVIILHNALSNEDISSLMDLLKTSANPTSNLTTPLAYVAKVIHQFNISNRLAFVGNSNAALPSGFFQNLKGNEIVIVNAGSAPYKVFDGVFSHSTFPAVHEGDNSLTLLMNAKQPFLYCEGRVYNNPLPGNMSQSLKELTGAVINNICTNSLDDWLKVKKPYQYLGEYISDLFNKGSELNQLFQGMINDYHDPKKDLYLFMLQNVFCQMALYHDEPMAFSAYQKLVSALNSGNHSAIQEAINTLPIGPSPHLYLPETTAVALSNNQIKAAIDLMARDAPKTFYWASTEMGSWSFYAKQCQTRDTRLFGARFCGVDLSPLGDDYSRYKAYATGYHPYAQNSTAQIAAALGDNTVLQRIANKQPQLLTQSYKNYTPVMVAIAGNVVSSLRFLMLHGIKLNADELIFLAQHGTVEAFRIVNQTQPIHIVGDFINAIVMAEHWDLFKYLVRQQPALIKSLSVDLIINVFSKVTEPEICAIVTRVHPTVCDKTALSRAIFYNNRAYIKSALTHQNCSFNGVITDPRDGNYTLASFIYSNELMTLISPHLDKETCDATLGSHVFQTTSVPLSEHFEPQSNIVYILKSNCDKPLQCKTKQTTHKNQIPCHTSNQTKTENYTLVDTTRNHSEITARENRDYAAEHANTAYRSATFGFISGALDEWLKDQDLNKIKQTLIRYSILTSYVYLTGDVTEASLFLAFTAVKVLLINQELCDTLTFTAASTLFDSIFNTPTSVYDAAHFLVKHSISLGTGLVSHVGGQYAVSTAKRCAGWFGFFSSNNNTNAHNSALTTNHHATTMAM